MSTVCPFYSMVVSPSCTGNPETVISANREDPDKMLQNVTSNQGLHGFLK